ncbi:MAG: 50S ribosomal protein L29 [bacterium]|nr:50S ribosomal protein L29 [bacterium]
MKTKDLKKKSPADLEKLIKSEQEELRKLRFSLAAGKTSKSHEAGQHRKTVARAQTILSATRNAEIAK